MRIGIVSPTYWEVVRFIRKENLKKKGPTSYFINSDKVSIQLEISGIGAENAKRACEKLVSSNPSVILCVGFAGGLRSEINAGDIVLDTDKSEPKIFNIITSLSFKKGIPCYSGQFWNSLSPLLKREQKLEVSRSSSSLAVEMEGESVWGAAKSRGIPFVSIRAISDTLSEDLPMIVTALGDHGNIGWNFWKTFISRPWEWPSFFRLAANSHKAAQNLQIILSDLVRHSSESGNLV